MEFKITSRQWSAEVILAPGEAPDVKKSYTDMTYRPERVSITFVQLPGKETCCHRYAVSGPRVLKGGRLGQDISDAEYGQPGSDWLQHVVRVARAQLAIGGES